MLRGIDVKRFITGVHRSQSMLFPETLDDLITDSNPVRVATPSENTVTRAKEIVALGKRVIASSRAADADPLVQQITKLANELLDGVDANGDGKITWHQVEGGLNEANKHMGLMVKREDMN
jgi:hypothetical protein